MSNSAQKANEQLISINQAHIKLSTAQYILCSRVSLCLFEKLLSCPPLWGKLNIKYIYEELEWCFTSFIHRGYSNETTSVSASISKPKLNPF